MKDIRGVSGGEMAMNTLSAIGSGASAGASVGGPWGAVAGAAVGLGGAPTFMEGGNPTLEAKGYWKNVRRALLLLGYSQVTVRQERKQKCLI